MNNSFIALLNRFDKILVILLKWLCIALFVAIALILTLNIIVRFIPFMSMHWFDEILELLYGALIFYGATAVWVNHGHFSVGDWLSKYIKSVWLRVIYRMLVEFASLLFIAIFFKYSIDLFMHTEEMTTAFAMSKKWLYACLPITGGIMLIYSFKNMYLELIKIIKPSLEDVSMKEDLNH